MIGLNYHQIEFDGSNFLKKFNLKKNNKMDELISTLQKSILESRSESDVAHALYTFQKEIHPFSCSQIGRKQVKEVFKTVWETLISTMNRFASLISIRVATFSVASTFLIRMTPFFPFQIRESFSEIVGSEVSLNQNESSNPNSNHETQSSSSKLIENKNNHSNRFIDLYPISNKPNVSPGTTSLSNVSILLASSFSFITNFISLEFVDDFLVRSPIFHHFIDKDSLESERLPDIISNICDNVGVEWYRSLLLALLQVNSSKGHIWSRSTIKTILAVIRHFPHILMNDVLKFFLESSNISISQKNYKGKDIKEFHIDNSEIALIGFLMTNLEGEMGNIDLLPFAKIALNIIKSSDYSLDKENNGHMTTNKIQIDNAFQILSVNSKYFRLKVIQIDEDTIKIIIFKGRTKFEKKSKFRKKRKKKLYYLSDIEIDQILNNYDKKYQTSPYKEVSDSEDFGYNNGEYYSSDLIEQGMIQSQNIKVHSALSSAVSIQFSSSDSLSIISAAYKKSNSSISNINTNSSSNTNNSSQTKSVPQSESKDNIEEPPSADNDNQSENKLFHSNDPFIRDINLNEDNCNNSDNNDEDENEIVDEVRLNYKPLLTNSSFFLLPLPINPFLIPSEQRNEESFPIFSAKLNALASYFTDANMIIYDDDEDNQQNPNVDKTSLDQAISIFEMFMNEKYDIYVSAVLQSLQKCVNCILMNTKDPKFIGMLRKIIFAPITSWFHALDILRVISAIRPELIDYSFGQKSFASSGLKEIVELVMDFSMIEKYDKLIEPCFNTVVGMTTSNNYYKIIDILLNHVDLFNPISIRRHLDIVYELIKKYEKDDHDLSRIIQPHCYKFFELLNFYYNDLNTLSSLFHILSLYDSSELFYTTLQSRPLEQSSSQSQDQLKSQDQSQSQSQDQSSETESSETHESTTVINTTSHIPEKLVLFNQAVSLAKLIANAGVTYLLGMKKTEDIAYFYDQIEHNFTLQSIEITCKGITDYKKQFSCIHAAMCFIFSLPYFISNIEDTFIYDMARRLFRFFPREVSTFLLNVRMTTETTSSKVRTTRNNLIHNIVARMEAEKDTDVHSQWCKLLIRFRASTKFLSKTITRTINDVAYFLRYDLLRLTVDEISSFINFLYVFDKTSCRFILRTIASIDKEKRVQLFTIASNPIKDLFSQFFEGETMESLNSENELMEDELLISSALDQDTFEKIASRIEAKPKLLDFYKKNLNGWVLLILSKTIKKRFKKQIVRSSKIFSETSSDSSVSSDLNNSIELNESYEVLKADSSSKKQAKLGWRPTNPYFDNYKKSREEEISLRLQSGADDSIMLFLQLNHIKSNEMENLTFSPNALVNVIKYLAANEPDCDLLHKQIIQSLTINDSLTSKRRALLEAMKINPSHFLQDFQVQPRLKKAHLLFIGSFLNSRQKLQLTKDDCALLFPFMLRLFESAKNVKRVQYVLTLMSVLITVSPTIPIFFLKAIAEYIFNDLKMSLTNIDNSMKQKILNLPDQVGLVFTCLARQLLIKSNSLGNSLYDVKNTSSLDFDDTAKHNLFTFHVSTQNIFSPTFTNMFFLVYSLNGMGMSDTTTSFTDLNISSFSFEFENELKRIISSSDTFPSLPSIIFKKASIIRILLFCKIPMLSSSIRSFIKHNYQDIFNWSKELKNPFIIDNIFNFSIDFFLDSTYANNQIFSSTSNYRNTICNYIREFILQNFFQQFIQSISFLHSSSSSFVLSCSSPGSPFLNTLLHFLLSICSNNNGNSDAISFAFSVSDMVPMQRTTLREFLTYMEILKIYLSKVQKPEDKKNIVLNSIKTWTKTLMIKGSNKENATKGVQNLDNEDFYGEESYDTYKYIVNYIYLMTQINVDNNEIIQAIYQNFEEKFEFFSFFMALSLYVKSLRNSFLKNEEENKTTFEDSDIGKLMLETFSNGRNVKKRDENIEALRMLIKGNYKEAYNLLMKC